MYIKVTANTIKTKVINPFTALILKINFFLLLFLSSPFKKNILPNQALKEKKLFPLRLTLYAPTILEFLPFEFSINSNNCFSGVIGLSCTILILFPLLLIV